MKKFEISLVTGNDTFDNLVKELFEKLLAIIQVKLSKDKRIIDDIVIEHDELLKAISDPDLFKSRFDSYLKLDKNNNRLDFYAFVGISRLFIDKKDSQVLEKFKDNLTIPASAKAILYYTIYIEKLREDFELNSEPSNISEVLGTNVLSSEEDGVKNWKIAQRWGEMHLELLLAGMELRTSMHPDPKGFYQQEIVEFSKLLNPDEENNSWHYLKNRFNYNKNDSSLDMGILFSICQEIKNFGYGRILTNSLNGRLEYLGVGIAVREYLEQLNKLVKPVGSGIANYEDGAVILIKLKDNYNFKTYVNTLWQNLFDKKYVDCEAKDFLGLFGFNKEGDSKPIIWKGTQVSFYFFLYRLLDGYSDMNNEKVFARLANEWFKPDASKRKTPFKDPMVYRSNLTKYSREGANPPNVIHVLPSKIDCNTLNGILDRSFS